MAIDLNKEITLPWKSKKRVNDKAAAAPAPESNDEAVAAEQPAVREAAGAPEPPASRKEKARKKSPAGYPSKEHMNLLVREKGSIHPRTAIPASILVVLAVALIAKFGVYDFLDAVRDKELEYSRQQSTLAQLQAQLVDYDEVKQEYESYETPRFSDDAGALEALGVVDAFIAPAASVTSIAYQDGVLTLNVTGVSLDGLGALVQTLDQQPLISNVSMSTAATQQTKANDVTAALVITLQGSGEEGDGAL